MKFKSLNLGASIPFESELNQSYFVMIQKQDTNHTLSIKQIVKREIAAVITRQELLTSEMALRTALQWESVLGRQKSK